MSTTNSDPGAATADAQAMANAAAMAGGIVDVNQWGQPPTVDQHILD